MLKLSANIEIARYTDDRTEMTKKWSFNHVTSIQINRRSDKLTDTCVLCLPKNTQWSNEAAYPIRQGDMIMVRLGYNDELQLVYKGYITSINTKNPMVISCDDEMYFYKDTVCTPKSYNDITLTQLLQDQFTDKGINLNFYVEGNEQLGEYRVTARTLGPLLDMLKKSHGFRFFFELNDGDPVLCCSNSICKWTGETQTFTSGVNIINEGGLVISDKSGQKVLTGSFTTFGGKLIDKLENIALQTADDEESKTYSVAHNTITYGEGGFRQEITLGERIG